MGNSRKFSNFESENEGNLYVREFLEGYFENSRISRVRMRAIYFREFFEGNSRKFSKFENENESNIFENFGIPLDHCDSKIMAQSVKRRSQSQMSKVRRFESQLHQCLH